MTESNPFDDAVMNEVMGTYFAGSPEIEQTVDRDLVLKVLNHPRFSNYLLAHRNPEWTAPSNYIEMMDELSAENPGLTDHHFKAALAFANTLKRE